MSAVTAFPKEIEPCCVLVPRVSLGEPSGTQNTICIYGPWHIAGQERMIRRRWRVTAWNSMSAKLISPCPSMGSTCSITSYHWPNKDFVWVWTWLTWCSTGVCRVTCYFALCALLSGRTLKAKSHSSEQRIYICCLVEARGGLILAVVKVLKNLPPRLYDM